MKTIGLLGGMSWESTAEYYRLINEHVKRELGGHHSAKVVLYSVDFQEIEHAQSAGRWDDAARILCDAARALERAGAEALVLCTNTMHKLAPELTSVKPGDAPVPVFDTTAIHARTAAGFCLGA